ACEDHPYRDYLVAFSVDSQRQAEAYRALLQGVPLMDLGPSARPLVTAMTTIDGADKSPGREAARRLTRGLDATSDDLAEILRTRAPEARPAVARQFLEVSPHSPQPVVALIENDWEGVKDKAATWEKQYAGSASVLAALGKKYASLKQYTDAERCLRAHVRLSPDRAGYQALAGVFKDQGNTDRWKETLDDYLKTEDSGLAHAGVRVELARHFMARKEFDKAKPYADAAAETAAAWAMLCAADVYEGLKDWETAEKWVRETAEHYETSRQTWLFWCVRTGKGDLAAARRLALERVELLRGTRDRNQLILSAACFILCEKPADAYEALHRQVTANPNDRLLAMQAALLADELGKTAERDELLAQVVKRSKAIEKKKADPKPADPKADPKTPPKPAAKKTPATDPETQAKLATLFKEIGELASLFIAALAPDAKPDLEAIAKAIEGVHADYRCEAQYLSGRFLELHGHPTQARKYYEACAETGGSRTPVVLGTFRLKAMKK
ncbi:MAG TPA: hypothetical protein VKD90_15555, partial [Gemmataceae bacterium]|nr:hypothetical protein [Gemmataceae bacterium]